MKATWSRLLWVWLSRTCWVWLFAACVGLVGWWLFSRYLEPSPQIIRLSSLLPEEATSFGSHELLFDSTNRWLCVKADVLPGAPRVKRCYVIDLDHPQGVHGSFIWSTLPGSLHTSIARPGGIREVYYQPDGILQIVDRSFLNGNTTITPLGKVDPTSYALLTSKGDTVAIVQPWPLWPWMMLASGGQLLVDPGQRGTHGLVVDIWNTAQRQRTHRLFLEPYNGRVMLSQDGRWLISLESSTIDWTPGYRGLAMGKDFPLMPALPRGIRVYDTKNSRTSRYLETPIENDGLYGAYRAGLMNNQLILLHTRYWVSQLGTGRQGSPRDHATHTLPMISLETGELTFLLDANPISLYADNDCPIAMKDPAWAVQYGSERPSWPELLVTLGQWFKVNLNTTYPRSQQGWLQVMNTQTRSEHMITFTLPSNSNNNSTWCYPTGGSAESMIFHIQHRAEGSTLYRWKIPCTVYPWWYSAGAGALVSVLILACYHSRRQTHPL